MPELIAKNPATGEIIKPYPALDEAAIENAINQAETAFESWRSTSFAERAKVLNNVAIALRDNKNAFIELMAKEMGKPCKEGGPEVEKAAMCSEYYAQHAEQFLKDEVLASDASRSFVTYQPLGVILSILPWNAPIWLASRFYAPTLMAGNTCVVKHDPNVPGCAQLLSKIFAEAAPAGVYVNTPIVNADAEKAIAHPAVQAVSFTGSSNAGAIVASTAAKYIKHAILELGGSDPFIVLSDADLDKAVDIAALSRMINAGQSCIAAKRMIVMHDVYDAFIAKLKAKLEVLKVGDPMLESTDVGPLARADLRENLDRQVTDSINAGAKCLLGGKPLEGNGFYYPVTLLTDVTEDMTVFKEETFGPVAAVIKAASVEHAIALANNTDYGLGAGVWTSDSQLAEKIALQINAGQVAINGIVKTDPRLPSGGIKRSGYGRELGPHGIKEFVNAKQIWLA